MVLHAKCNGCSRTTDLSKCARCQVALYCSRDHQAEDFPLHKNLCKEVKHARAKLDKEAEKLRRSPDGDVFVVGEARFWRIQETRPYMHAKFAMVDALADIGTHGAMAEALREGLHALQLGRGDGMGYREIVPALFLHIGQLQECYDFIKWWATSDVDSPLWRDPAYPYLDVKNADMTESITMFEKSELHHLAALTFIKLTLAQALMDERNAQRVAESGGGDTVVLPAPVGENLQQFLASKELPNKATAPRERQLLQKKLAVQAKKAFQLTHAKNKHFWSAVMDPSPVNEEPMSPYYARGDKGEVRPFLMANAQLWLQDPIAKAFVTKQLKEM